jgi:archaellum biogenesis ATPase FlaH
MSTEQVDSFSKMGRTYQEKTVQSILTDQLFAEQMMDVLKPNFFELGYLQTIAELFYEHKRQYRTFPSPELIGIMVQQDTAVEDLTKQQVQTFLKAMIEHPLNGDTGYIQSSSLDFCKRQTLKEALVKVIDCIEDSDYDSVQGIVKDALSKGASRDLGHDYMSGFPARAQKNLRQPISTGWPILDRCFNGGWERGTLSTFIAPTGAGKSMFLVNCGAAAIAQGLNVLYVTCEMADYKIGIRFDSYFSGIEINNVPDSAHIVEQQVRDQVKGRLFIKEFPTKTATVQTIRSHIQRLQATKEFIPDMVIVDYADLLRGSRGYGDKRFELEGIYEELRALAQEFKVVLVTADQTNRSGLDMEVVTIGQIGESYAKATVCDVIMTVSRRADDKTTNSGRLFIAKSRLGQDGMVFPFQLNTATVKVTLLETGVDPIALFMENSKNVQTRASERYRELFPKKVA